MTRFCRMDRSGRSLWMWATVLQLWRRGTSITLADGKRRRIIGFGTRAGSWAANKSNPWRRITSGVASSFAFWKITWTVFLAIRCSSRPGRELGRLSLAWLGPELVFSVLDIDTKALVEALVSCSKTGALSYIGYGSPSGGRAPPVTSDRGAPGRPEAKWLRMDDDSREHAPRLKRVNGRYKH